MLGVYPLGMPAASSIGPTPEGDSGRSSRIARGHVCERCGRSFKSDNELSLHKSLDHRR
jgi:hypothetical protein